jgi:hypothetical protein
MDNMDMGMDKNIGVDMDVSTNIDRRVHVHCTYIGTHLDTEKDTDADWT